MAATVANGTIKRDLMLRNKEDKSQISTIQDAGVGTKSNSRIITLPSLTSINTLMEAEESPTVYH